MKFSKPPQSIDFPQFEHEVLKLWKDTRAFERSVEEKSVDNSWSFYDGPPFATGLPHYGHLLAGTIKDVIPRYWAMRGKRVSRRFGWDCHGLPVEFEMEQQLGLKGRNDILDYGVDKFNEACRSIVLRYTSEWQKTIERMGRWIDFENDYKTMDCEFMESVWSVFKSLWDKGLIYEDKKSLPYSPRISTTLSNFEANLNYRDVQDPSVTVKLKVVGEANTYLLIWTTTPWTLPANLAVAVHPDFDYVKVKQQGSGDQFIAHAALVDGLFEKSGSAFDIVETFKGSKLEGLNYEPLIKAFDGQLNEHCHQVYLADFVTAETGTGLVHIAPGFGEDDFEIGKKHGLPILDHLDESGVITDLAPEFSGLYFKDADKKIIQHLKAKTMLFSQETVQHSYPFCYRSDQPLIYRAISTWFVNVDKIKQQLIANNQQINWVPSHLKDGRFGKWMDNARDWAISRNRFWGNPIPVWVNAESGESLCVGSRAELEKLTGTKIDDLHKHFIDKLTITSPKTGKTLTRVPHVLDCWFESGSMPYAQQHYPFSVDDQAFNKIFPADFIAEGLDQTRGWFYTLLVLSTALEKGPAFKNVVVNGIVLAEDGRKMSKRLKNYPSPDEVFEKFGADALRAYFLQSGGVRAEDLKFSEASLTETTRKLLLPLWNAYSFLATYASVDGWDPQNDYTEQRAHDLDRWIDVKLETLKQTMQESMESYELAKTMPPMLEFLDDLTNWYVRRSRRRFWKSENDNDKFQAYSTLYSVIVQYCKIAAPFMPFLSESVFQRMRLGHSLTSQDSVHLEDYPMPTALSESDRALTASMDLARSAVALGRELREKLKIKNRQPLATLFVGIATPEEEQGLKPMIELIQDELNVKSVRFLPSSEMATWVVRPNFKQLGKRLGPKIKPVQQACGELSNGQVIQLIAGNTMDIGGEMLGRDDLLIDLKAAESFDHPCHSAGSVVIALDSDVTPELEQEGYARELINRVQRFRKDSDFNIEDRINLYVEAPSTLASAFESCKPLIESETLSTLSFKKPSTTMKTSGETIGKDKLTIGVEKR